LFIKPNQIGTIKDIIATSYLTFNHGRGAFVAHRSIGTENNFIIDMAIALSIGNLKIWTPEGGEWLKKYNQLLRIEQRLKASVTYTEKLRRQAS
jgi:enolase